MRKIIVPAYETGVAVPPAFGCICGKCKKGGEPLSCHHNAFEEPYYKDPPGIRQEASRAIVALFRGTQFNRFYVTDCTHHQIQPTGMERSKRPKLDVIHQFMGEAAILSNLDRTVHLTNSELYKKYVEWQLSLGFSKSELKRRWRTDWASREESISMVDSIAVMPEEVVTASLVYSAPEMAAQRLQSNPEQPLIAPANWPRKHLRLLVNRSADLRGVLESAEGAGTRFAEADIDEVGLAA